MRMWDYEMVRGFLPASRNVCHFSCACRQPVRQDVATLPRTRCRIPAIGSRLDFEYRRPLRIKEVLAGILGGVE